MSIYASKPEIGMTSHGVLDGTVRAYAGSGVWPGRVDGNAWVGLAVIPGYCVPGAPEDAECTSTVGEYLRLDVADRGDPIRTTVVLTVASATVLRDQLSEWIARPKEPTQIREPG
ncbi:hypothetical protein [Microbacterium sp. PF5]|uniref:hypothetical protein n=1 Tax=Microbacterium sp. PF5 TaxID=2305435 RepID=UPI00109B9D74|nr:hypothetical protein [Microbacterium sp. PF5]